MKYSKRIGKFILPRVIKRHFSRVRRSIIFWSRQSKRVKLVELLADDLIRDLINGGVVPGDTIMVHSSLSHIGNVSGGPQTLIKSLIDAVTESGTVLMPAYGSVEEVLKDCRQGKPVDLRTRKSELGLVSETFRSWPGVRRSSHPFSSICAWGKNAEYITSGHATGSGICHVNSPIARLVELKGKVLGIGVSLGPVSIYHVIEGTWDEFPFHVYSEVFPVKYIDWAGNTVERHVARHDPVLASTRIDHRDGEWIREKFTSHFARKGILRTFQVGAARSWVMETAPLCEELKRLASKGITMYLTREKWMSLNNGKESIDNW
jgi:aminoglycoside 3-N-acetyltransferase